MVGPSRYNTDMLIGSHLSIAGGLHNALLRASQYHFNTCAIFVRNQRQWKTPPLTDEQVELFRRTRKQLGFGPVVAHGSYLVNLAGLAPVRRKSIKAFAEEFDRCCRLGIEYLVIHPGARRDKQLGIRKIADAINETLETCEHRRPKVLLETTAGQGNGIGSSFEQLAEIISLIARKKRVGVCLDTCHIFAAGYDIRTPGNYAQTMQQFDEIIGIDKLLAIHLNDSRGELGTHLDRHAHIGEGTIGLAGFANFVNDPALTKVPMIMETPKGLDEAGQDYDWLNAHSLKSLVKTG